MTTKAATLPWNLVTKNLPGHGLLLKKIRVRITKLEKHLVHFPAGTVHLHIALERHGEKEYYTAGLTLHEELKRQHWLLKHKATEEIPTDETKTLPEDAERAAGYDVEQPLDIIEEELEPPVVRTESLIPDSTAMPPDEIVAQKDALARLEQDMRNWPRSEREVFELYYVEGLEPEEITMVTGQALAEVQRHIASIHSRLREEILGTLRLPMP